MRRLGILTLIVAAPFLSCELFRKAILASSEPEALDDPSSWVAKVNYDDSSQKSKKIEISLKQVASGFAMPVDLQFLPGESQQALVAEKEGKLKWVNFATNEVKTLLQLNVLTSSEQGLLGVAFHPNFTQNRRLFLNAVMRDQNGDATFVMEYKWPEGSRALEKVADIIRVEQPYPNHNAGQLAFGPDGMLYIGFGDGGWADDPHNHGQNLETLLGSVIRIDVDKKDGSKKYSIPSDNPFYNHPKARKEIFVYGVRNPWRFSFDRQNRLVIADVGQNKWEEVTFAPKGANLGWNIMEGFSCFDKSSCDKSGLQQPIVVYPRDQGISITGGYVYEGGEIPELKNKYIYADYGSQRMWAIELPDRIDGKVADENVFRLGKWNINIATFGKNKDGDVFAADFSRGGIYKISPK